MMPRCRCRLALAILVAVLGAARSEAQLSQYVNSVIFAQDRGQTFLGKASTNRFSNDSILNTFGTYGSAFSTYSIRNNLSNYGSSFSSYSAYSAFATQPPILYALSGGRYVAQAYLSKNATLWPRVDPDDLIAYLLALGTASPPSNAILLEGTYAYERVGNSIAFGVDRITNYRPLGSTSGTLTISIWATATVYTGSGTLIGYKLVEGVVGTLQGGFHFSNVIRSATPATIPSGNYNLVFVLSEWSGTEYLTVDWGNFNQRVDIGTVSVAPTITAQPTSRTVSAGASVSFSVTATGSGYLGYQWTKNGATLFGQNSPTLNLSTVQAADAGTYAVIVTNAAGSATSAGATLTVTPAAVSPSITKQPTSATVTAGQSVTLTVTASGTSPLSYQWRKNGVAIPGATSASLALTAVSAGDAGTYSVVVANSAGSVTSADAVVKVQAAAQPPSILTQPAGATVVAGQTVTFTVTAAGTGELSYVWRKDGSPVAGATGPSLTLAAIALADAGRYSVVVSNSAGSVTSAEAVLAVTEPPASRIANVSIRTTLNARQLLIVGLTMAGGEKPVLMRAVGPGLAAFGVPNAMPDPDLSLYDGATRVGANDNWGGATELSSAAAAVGAFPLSPSSKDAVLLRAFSGGRTLQVQGVEPGNVIVEAYDAGSGQSPRLVNVSARNYAGAGGDILIAGFSVLGNAPKRVLIRAVGPTLGAFGVPATLADPKLEVYSGTNRIAENDNWAPSLSPAFASVGAFGLIAGSRDAALELSLQPGGYTVHVSPATGSGGETLIEVYELP